MLIRIAWMILAVFNLCDRISATVVCGTVLDMSNDPIPAAVISITNSTFPERSLQGETDSRGKVCIRAVPDGEFIVEAAKEGFARQSYSPVVINLPDQKEFTFHLPVNFDPLRSTYVGVEAILFGTLTDSGRIASHTNICLYADQRSYCAETNDVGQYRLAVRPGRYKVEFTLPDGTQVVSSIDVKTPSYFRNQLAIPRQAK